jgi:hypothetical protein
MKIQKVTKEMVTRDDFRAMAGGQIIDFALPGRGQFESAQSAAGQMKKEHMKFATKFTGDIEKDQWSIQIERLM